MALFYRLYEERSSQVESRLEEVKKGIALEYIQPLDDLRQNLENRLEVAGNSCLFLEVFRIFDYYWVFVCLVEYSLAE